MRGRGKDIVDAYTYSDWNAPNITCLFPLLGKWATTMLTIKAGVCAVSNIVKLIFSAAKNSKTMLALRLYVSALTSLFLVLVIANRGLGILEAVVITCAIVYLILDVRTDLHALKNELQLLKELEKQVSSLLR